MRASKLFISNVRCNTCGTVQPITRRYKRPAGHIKTTWCLKCKDRTNHTELGVAEGGVCGELTPLGIETKGRHR